MCVPFLWGGRQVKSRLDLTWGGGIRHYNPLSGRVYPGSPSEREPFLLSTGSGGAAAAVLILLSLHFLDAPAAALPAAFSQQGRFALELRDRATEPYTTQLQP